MKKVIYRAKGGLKLLLSLCVLMVLAMPASAQVLLNPGFETDVGGTPSGTAPTSWSNLGTFTHAFVGNQHAGANSAEFNITNADVLRQQATALIAGHTYRLAFFAFTTGGGANSLQITVPGGGPTQAVANGAYAGAAYTVDFVAAAATGNIQFQANGVAGQFIYLDDIALTDITAPEVNAGAASTPAALLFGVLLLLADGRRRRNVS